MADSLSDEELREALEVLSESTHIFVPDSCDSRLFVLSVVRELIAARAELNGTDSLAGDPNKWGLRAMCEGLTLQRDAALVERDLLKRLLRECRRQMFAGDWTHEFTAKVDAALKNSPRAT